MKVVISDEEVMEAVRQWLKKKKVNYTVTCENRKEEVEEVEEFNAGTAVREFLERVDELFERGPDSNCAFAHTGDRMVDIGYSTTKGIKWSDETREAFDIFEKEFWSYVHGKTCPIFWREYPKLRHYRLGFAFTARVFCYDGNLLTCPNCGKTIPMKITNENIHFTKYQCSYTLCRHVFEGKTLFKDMNK